MRKTLYIGPPGNPVPIPDVEPGPARINRAGTVKTLLSGGSVVQQAPYTSREWDLSWNVLNADTEARIKGLMQGAYGAGPFAWWDPMVARLNLLGPLVAVCDPDGFPPGTIADNVLHSATEAGPFHLDDGLTVAHSLQGTVVTPRVPVAAPGIMLAASAQANAATTMTMVFTDALGATVQKTSTSSTRAGRISVTGTVPPRAVYVQLIVGATTTTVAGLALIEGDTAPLVWHPGEGIPAVEIVGGLDRTWGFAGNRLIRERLSASLKLVEVPPSWL